MDVQPPATPLTDGVVTLRQLRMSDRPAVLATMADPLVRRWLNMPEYPSEADFDELLRIVADGWSAGTRWDLAITEEADVVVGAVIASKRPRDNWELAYLAGEAGRGRGLVTRSVRLVCTWLFDAGVGRIEIRTHPENDASQHVAERCGFQLEGRERRSIWLHATKAGRAPLVAPAERPALRTPSRFGGVWVRDLDLAQRTAESEPGSKSEPGRNATLRTSAAACATEPGSAGVLNLVRDLDLAQRTAEGREPVQRANLIRNATLRTSAAACATEPGSAGLPNLFRPYLAQRTRSRTVKSNLVRNATLRTSAAACATEPVRRGC